MRVARHGLTILLLALITAHVSIGDPVIVHPGLCLLHGQIVVDGLVEIHPGVVIAPFVTLGLQPNNVVGPTLERGVRVGTGAKVLAVCSRRSVAVVTVRWHRDSIKVARQPMQGFAHRGPLHRQERTVAEVLLESRKPSLAIIGIGSCAQYSRIFFASRSTNCSPRWTRA